MKILFFSRLFYPHVGGIEKHLEKISEKLIQKGYSVAVLTTKYDDKLIGHEEYKGMHIYRFYQPNIKFLGMFYTWFWLIKNIKLIKEADILHIHDVFIWYWPFKIIFPFKKIFLTIHGRWGEFPIPFKDLVQKKLAVWFSNGVIAVGDYIPKNYGIKADIVTYGATDIQEKSKLRFEKENNIVFVGRMDKDIALSKTFKVFNKLENYHIDFCGDGELRTEAKKYGKVHGFTDPLPFYKKAQYCFASGYLTILEAIANKCLVFAMYDHSLQEDYYKSTPFKDFIVISKDPQEMYQKFRYYESHQKELKDKVDKGYEWVKDQTWDKMVENYETLWN